MKQIELESYIQTSFVSKMCDIHSTIWLCLKKNIEVKEKVEKKRKALLHLLIFF